MRMLSVAGLAVISALGAGGGEGFDLNALGGHAAVRTAFAPRAVRGARIDGHLAEAFWSRAEPITALRSYGEGGPGLKPLYLVHRPAAGAARVAADQTFVRVACDDRCLYLAAVCLVAPRPQGAGVQPIGKDQLLFRFDPGARGRHAVELVFNVKGCTRAYDSHETWGYGLVPEVAFAGRALSPEDAGRLPEPERSSLAALGAGTSGWLMEAAIPWHQLADQPQPGDGGVWGLQVARSSAAGEESSWGRNIFNGFDPQGHIYFGSRPPAVRVEGVSFGRTIEGLTPWTVWLRNVSAEPAGARVRLACRGRVENLDFMGAHLAPGESRRLVSWLPYGQGVNRVEVRVADEDRRPVYGCELLALVQDEPGARVLDSSGGFAGVSVSPQLAAPGAELSVNVDWEEDMLGRCPLGPVPGEGLLVELAPEGSPRRALEPSGMSAAPAEEGRCFRGGRVSFKVRLPADAPEGFARLTLAPRSRMTSPGRPAELALSARVYVAGPRVEGFRRLLTEARAAFEKADGMSCEDARKLHWGSAPPGYPEKRDPDEFTALFGGKHNVIFGEQLLKTAERDCTALENLPEYETDLRYRLERLAAGARPERGILWKAYRSDLDGAWQPYSLYVPEAYDPAKRWPLIVDLHGYSGGWDLKPGDDKVRAARSVGGLLLKPYLRGKTWYLGWGESEMLALLAAVRSEYSVDPDRVHVSGFSMGGCGAMKFLASYPDIFASGGGSSGRAEPLAGLRAGLNPSWTADGFKDQGTSWTGGRMFALHAAEVEPVSARHRGDAFTGHGYRIDRTGLYSWLLSHPLERWPRRLTFGVWSARFASLRWVTAVEPERYGRIARVTAEVRGGAVHLDTENVAGLRLGLSEQLLPTKPGGTVRVFWNGRKTLPAPGAPEARLGSLAGGHEPGRKRPNELAGPMEDFLVRKFVAVRGTLGGSADEIAKCMDSFQEAWQHIYQSRLPVHDDVGADRKELASNHLLCLGTEETNAFLREHAAKLPIRVEGGKIRIGRRTTSADGARFWYLTLNPLNPDRYMLVVGSQRPADTRKALQPLVSKPFRHFDYAVYGRRSARPESERTARFAKLMGISAFGWFDRDWQVCRAEALLPDCEFMDNQNPSLVLTHDGEWRPGAEPHLRGAGD